MDRKEIANELHKNGFNCAQAVAVAFCNTMGADPVQAFKMAEPFGFGMGDSYGPCGALSGACMVVGMKRSDADLDNPKSKRDCYRLISAIKAEFNERVGATVCHEIKGMDGGEQKLSCDGCIELGCELLDKYLLGIYPDGEEPDIKVIKNPNAKF